MFVILKVAETANDMNVASKDYMMMFSAFWNRNASTNVADASWTAVLRKWQAK